jgi:hypothetical protein
VFHHFVLVGCGGRRCRGNLFNKSAPKAHKRPPQRLIPLVQVETVQPGTHRVVVPGMERVIPARELVLKARVVGEIVKIHPDFR